MSRHSLHHMTRYKASSHYSSRASTGRWWGYAIVIAVLAVPAVIFSRPDGPSFAGAAKSTTKSNPVASVTATTDERAATAAEDRAELDRGSVTTPPSEVRITSVLTRDDEPGAQPASVSVTAPAPAPTAAVERIAPAGSEARPKPVAAATRANRTERVAKSVSRPNRTEAVAKNVASVRSNRTETIAKSVTRPDAGAKLATASTPRHAKTTKHKVARPVEESRMAARVDSDPPPIRRPF